MLMVTEASGAVSNRSVVTRWSSPIWQWLWWELRIATSKQAGSCTKQVVMIGNQLWVSMYKHNLISNLISNLYLILSCLVSCLVTLLQCMYHIPFTFQKFRTFDWVGSTQNELEYKHGLWWWQHKSLFLSISTIMQWPNTKLSKDKRFKHFYVNSLSHLTIFPQ